MELKHVQLFVIGACQQREAQSPGFCDDLTRFTQATVEVVWAYLQGRKTLDGSCSDFDCWLAHEAAKVFGWPENQPRKIEMRSFHLHLRDREHLPGVWVVARDESQIRATLGHPDFEAVRILPLGTPAEDLVGAYKLPEAADSLRIVLSFLLNS